MTEKSIELSIIEAIGKSDLKDIFSEGAELALDSLLKDGLIKEIPVIRTLIELYNTGVTIKDYLFTKKLLKFLKQVSQAKKEDYEEFVRKLDSDEKFKRRVGENLILLLDRMDDMGKPEMVGMLFKAYISRQIDYGNYQRLASAVDRVYLPDLDDLKKYYKNTPTSGTNNQGLAALGLLHSEVETRVGASPIVYSISHLGKLLIEICLDDKKIQH